MKNMWEKWIFIARFLFQDPDSDPDPAWQFESGSWSETLIWNSFFSRPNEELVACGRTPIQHTYDIWHLTKVSPLLITYIYNDKLGRIRNRIWIQNLLNCRIRIRKKEFRIHNTGSFFLIESLLQVPTKKDFWVYINIICV